MSKKFRVKIITMDKEVYNSDAISLVTVNAEGEIQFLANHATMITNSVPCQTVITEEDGKENRLFTSEGILIFKENTLTLMTSAAELAKDIDLERAEKAVERAQKRLQKGIEFDVKRAQLALARANERIKIKTLE